MKNADGQIIDVIMMRSIGVVMRWLRALLENSFDLKAEHITNKLEAGVG